MGTDARIEVIPAAWRRGIGRAATPALVLALALAGAGGAAAVSATTPGGSPAATATSRTTSLWLSGSSLSYADAQEASALLGWEASAYSLPGVGISRATGSSGDSLLVAARRLLPVEVGSPEVVVLQGGEADNGGAAQSLSDSTAALIDEVRRSTDQGTRVVLVGPIPGEVVPDSLRRVNEVLARVAQQSGVPYVDALAAGWRAGAPVVPERLAAALAD